MVRAVGGSIKFADDSPPLGASPDPHNYIMSSVMRFIIVDVEFKLKRSDVLVKRGCWISLYQHFGNCV